MNRTDVPQFADQRVADAEALFAAQRRPAAYDLTRQ